MNLTTITDGPYSVTVREATVLDGMRRELLRMEGVKANEEEEALSILRIVTYPDYTCCLEKSEGLAKQMTFEEFCKLPQSFADKWGRVVYQKNPHFVAMEPDEKKVLQPGDGSANKSAGETSSEACPSSAS